MGAAEDLGLEFRFNPNPHITFRMLHITDTRVSEYTLVLNQLAFQMLLTNMKWNDEYHAIYICHIFL